LITDHFIASKISVDYFSKYRIHKFCSGTNGWTDGQVENIMLPVTLDWRSHKKYLGGKR